MSEDLRSEIILRQKNLGSLIREWYKKERRLLTISFKVISFPQHLPLTFRVEDTGLASSSIGYIFCVFLWPSVYFVVIAGVM